MRGAARLLSAVLVVVGTDLHVCLRWDSNKAPIVGEEPSGRRRQEHQQRLLFAPQVGLFLSDVSVVLRFVAV